MLSLHSHFGPLQVASISLKRAYAHVWHLGLFGHHPEDKPLECLALVASGTCACGFSQNYSKYTNKQTNKSSS